MCLTLKLKNRFCLSYDILVHKMLNDRQTNNIITPYQRMCVNFENGKAELWINDDDLKPNIWEDIHQGIHSFYDLYECRLRAMMFGFSPYYAIIPAGTPFYVGNTFDVVSSKLIIFETGEDLAKYEEKNGKATPLKKLINTIGGVLSKNA